MSSPMSQIQSRVAQAKAKMGSGGLLKREGTSGGLGFGLLEGIGSGGMLGETGQLGQKVQQARSKIQSRMGGSGMASGQLGQNLQQVRAKIQTRVASMRAGRGYDSGGLNKQNINIDSNNASRTHRTSSISVAD